MDERSSTPVNGCKRLEPCDISPIQPCSQGAQSGRGFFDEISPIKADDGEVAKKMVELNGDSLLDMSNTSVNVHQNWPSAVHSSTFNTSSFYEASFMKGEAGNELKRKVNECDVKIAGFENNDALLDEHEFHHYLSEKKKSASREMSSVPKLEKGETLEVLDFNDNESEASGGPREWDDDFLNSSFDDSKCQSFSDDLPMSSNAGQSSEKPKQEMPTKTFAQATSTTDRAKTIQRNNSLEGMWLANMSKFTTDSDFALNLATHKEPDDVPINLIDLGYSNASKDDFILTKEQERLDASFFQDEQKYLEAQRVGREFLKHPLVSPSYEVLVDLIAKHKKGTSPMSNEDANRANSMLQSFHIKHANEKIMAEQHQNSMQVDEENADGSNGDSSTRMSFCSSTITTPSQRKQRAEFASAQRESFASAFMGSPMKISDDEDTDMIDAE